MLNRFPRNETGASGITELTVAVALFAIILLITTLVLSTLAQSSNVTSRLSNSTESTQLAVEQVEHYMAGAVSPNTAAASSQAGSNAFSLSTSYPCWGINQPYSAGGQLTIPETDAILIAHDFDLEFCGYVPGSTAPHVPHVIRVFMTTPCNTARNTCTLEVLDYTTVNTGYTSCTAKAASCTSTNTYTGTTATTLLTVSNVACDSSCQTSSLGSGHAGASSSTVTTSNDAIACEDQSPAPATGCAGATPPLFSYYGTDQSPTSGGSGSPAGAENPSALPLIDIGSSTSTISNPSALQSIQSVELDMTIVGTRSPGLNPTANSPSTTVNDLLYLTSLQTTVTAPFPPTNVSASATTTKGEIQVNWTVPYDGGLNITSFTITPYLGLVAQSSLAVTVGVSPPPNCSPLCSTTGSSDDTLIASLTTGSNYTFTVVATNYTTLNSVPAGGSSEASLPSNSVTAP